MGEVKGYTSIAAFKKSSAWGTAVECGAGEGIRFTGIDPGGSLQFLDSNELSGSRSRKAGDRGNILHAPTLNAEMTYEGLERILAQAMGSSPTPSQVGGDDAYTHVMKPANELDGIHGTLMAYLQSKPTVLEWDNCKLNGFTFTVGSGQQRASMAFPIIARQRKDGNSSVNTNSTAENITFVSNRDFVNFAHLKQAGGDEGVRINATSGGALGTGDIVYPSQITITLQNQLPTDDVTPAHVPYIDEPIGGSFLGATVSMTFSKGFQDLTRLQDMLSESAVQKKMSIVFLGPVADGAANFGMKFYFPSLQFTGDPPGISGPDRQPETINLSASAVDASPTGFPSGYTDAVTIELVNQRNSTALA